MVRNMVDGGLLGLVGVVVSSKLRIMIIMPSLSSVSSNECWFGFPTITKIRLKTNF